MSNWNVVVMREINQGMSLYFLEIVTKRFKYLKSKTEKAIMQINDEENFYFCLDKRSNSIAILMKHLSGNMKSRWTDFLITNGEKSWRDRPSEFNRNLKISREKLLNEWDTGWKCLFSTLASLTPEDLLKEVTIRDKIYTVVEAIIWQLSHYSAHIGQIIYLTKHIQGDYWKPLDNLPTF